MKTCSCFSEAKTKKRGQLSVIDTGTFYFCRWLCLVAVQFIIGKFVPWKVVYFNLEYKLKAKVFVESVKHRESNRITKNWIFHSSKKHLLRMHSDFLVPLLFCFKILTGFKFQHCCQWVQVGYFFLLILHFASLIQSRQEGSILCEEARLSWSCFFYEGSPYFSRRTENDKKKLAVTVFVQIELNNYWIFLFQIFHINWVIVEIEIEETNKKVSLWFL